MSFNVGTIEASSVIDQSGFTRGIGQMHSRGNRFVADFRANLSRVSDDLMRVGRSMSTFVTAPIVGMGVAAVRAFGKQEEAEMQLRAALQANGREVDSLFNKYNNFASEMQRLTVVGDEATLAMLQQAESMGTTGDAAERAVKNAISMQAAFGVGADRALRYTAALEQGEATMLRRYIPALRGIEDETLMVAKAQEILSNSFSVAEAQAQTASGQMAQMRNAVGDLMEVIGGIIAEAITPFVNKLKEFAEQAQNVDRETIAMGIAVAGLGAALGPVLIAVGTLAKLIGLIMTPMIAKIALLTAMGLGFYYVYRNMGAFADRMPGVADVVRNASKGIQFLVDDMRALGRRIRATVDAINDMLYTYDDWKRDNEDLVDSQPDENDARPFVTWSEVLKDALSGVGGGIKFVISEITSLIGLMPEMEEEGKKHVKTNDEIADSYRDMARSISLVSIASAELQGATRAVSIYDKAVRQARSETEKLMVAVGSAAGAMSRAVQNANQQLMENMAEMSYMLQTVVASAITDFAETLGDAFTGDAGASGFFNNILMVVAEFGKQLGRMLIASGVAALAFQKLLINPIAAIAAGAALVVAATAAQRLLAAGPGQSVNDALISNGRVVHLHPNDDVLAMKNFSNLGGGGGRTAIINLKSVNEMDSRTIWEANRRYEVSI